ncbi:hypothetical protein DXG01_013046 [Tephrocybe rancida]|nr:hypothetical protein DXG01_013046 [Tephrocybe rancida]
MAWKPSFNSGISCFQELHLDEALNHFSKALKFPGGDQQHIIYDSRAAVYEKIGKPKEALRDSKSVIKLAPDQWQGYARAARLFLLASKFDAALTMADAALTRIKLPNTKRRDEISKLRDEILGAQEAEVKRVRLTQNQTSKLPVELLNEVMSYVVWDDAPALIRFLRVCGFWRNVALTTPVLWDTLILTTKSPMRKLSLWIKQSKCRIRELHIREDAAAHADWPFSELADIHWDQVRVCSSVSWDLAGYIKKQKLGNAALASLKEFEMIEPKICRVRASPELFPLLQKAGVRSLSFNTSYFSWKQVSEHLTSLRLLNVVGCSTDPAYLLHALKANRRLQTIKILDRFHYNYVSKPPLSLHYLTHLELMGSHASSLVESLSTPNLNTLILKGSRESLDRAFKALHRSRCTKHLTHLVVEQSTIDPAILKRFLESAVSLARLELTALNKCANIIVEALAGPIFFPRQHKTSPSQHVVLPAGTGDTPILCPALMYLAVSQCPDIRTGPLVRLVKSRKSTAAAVAAEAEEIEDASDVPPPPPPQKCARITTLIMDECEHIEAQWLPWFRDNVQTVSCQYQSKMKSKWR